MHIGRTIESNKLLIDIKRNLFDLGGDFAGDFFGM